MTQPKSVPAALKLNGVMPKPPADIEVGVSSHLPFVTPFRNAWEILRDEEITVKQLAAMRRTDGQARALFRLITLPIRAALKTATYTPENHVDGGEEEAQFVEQMFTLPASGGGMTVSINRVIAQMLLGVFDGFSAFEMVYWKPTKGPLADKWTIKKLAHRPAETLTFLVDDRTELVGLRQQVMYQGRQYDVVIPAEHVVHYTANAEEKPWYGQSYFQSAFFHWDKKFKLYAIAHIAAQRAAVGTRIGKMPRGPVDEERRRFERALADLCVAQSMTMPNDFEVDSLDEKVNFPFLDYINHHNSQMSKSILAAFFDDQQGSGGDTTLVDFGRQSDALFMLLLQTIMSEIEDVINSQIIPRFIDWNFDSGKYPTFRFGSLTEEQKAAAIDLFKTLSTAGQSLSISQEFLHELEKQMADEFGLEVDYEAVEKRMDDEAELQRQQQDMQMQQQQMDMDAPDAGGSPDIDPSLLPDGFALSNEDIDAATVALTDLAADLLAEAYADLGIDDLNLTRGKARQGFKRVQTPEGAKAYGVPVGTPITRAIAERVAKHGVKGKPYGGVRRDSASAKTGHEVLGGGPGAKAQNPGGVNTTGGAAKTKATPQRVLYHPDHPGAQLLDYGDGTVAVRDGSGNTSSRQRFAVEKFLQLGWKITHGDQQAEHEQKAKAAKKTAPKRTPKAT